MRNDVEYLRDKIKEALLELGIPGMNFPTPVSNAVDILSEAIRETDNPGYGMAEANEYIERTFPGE